MFVEIRIKREVTVEEASVLATITKVIKQDQGDIFRIVTDSGVHLNPSLPPPTLERSPRRTYKVSSWGERVDRAFDALLSSYPEELHENINLLKESLDWNVQDKAAWVPYTLDNLKDLLVFQDDVTAENIVRKLLYALNRKPAAKPCPGYCLPPTIDAVAAKSIKQQDERMKANLAVTGDPHIGFADEEYKNKIEAALIKLDYDCGVYHKMTTAEWLTWAGVTDITRSAYMTLCYAYRRISGRKLVFGKPVQSPAGGLVASYYFPIPKAGEKGYPGERITMKKLED